jgi:4-hydroxybenzoate polyprenyltransferase
MPPIRLKKRFWISNISIAFARGFLGFLAAWCIFDSNPQDSPVPWLVGGIMFLVLIGATTAKDFTDVEGDAKFGMRTLPVVYGQRKSAIISSAFLIFPYLLVPIGWFAGILIFESIIMTFLMAWGALIAYLMLNAPTKQDGKMENSKVWGHMYFLLMTMQIGFAAVYIIAGMV